MWEIKNKKLLKEIEDYVENLLGEKTEENFILSVYEEVCLTSGYEEHGKYSHDVIAICTKRKIVEMIEEYCNE